MKKLGPINPDIENWDLLLLACGKIDDLIDLVNSQQEAIEKLERVFETQTVPDIMLPATKKPYKIIEMNPSELSQLLDTEQADDKPEYNFDKFAQGAREFVEKNDTHRTVTLRIPKGMTFVEALFYADLSLNMSDNQAKKALDEVQG